MSNVEIKTNPVSLYEIQNPAGTTESEVLSDQLELSQESNTKKTLGKVSNIFLATTLALNTVYPNPETTRSRKHDSLDLTTVYGAGFMTTETSGNHEPISDRGEYGAFYYGHHAYISTSPGISDWYRGFGKKLPTGHALAYPKETYTKQDDRLIEKDIEQMEEANLDFAISSWDSIGDARDQFMQHLKSIYEANPQNADNLKWTFIYEKEGYGDPNDAEINHDMEYMQKEYFKNDWFLKDENGKPVLFIYASDSDNSEYLNKWAKIAGEKNLHLVMRSYDGYDFFPSENADKVDWYDYQPAYGIINNKNSVMISPSYHRKGDSRIRKFSKYKWTHLVNEFVDSDKKWKIIISWNERYENTGVKPRKIYTTSVCPIDGNYPVDDTMFQILKDNLPPNPNPKPVLPQPDIKTLITLK